MMQNSSNLSLDIQVASLAAWMSKFKGILIIVFDIKGELLVTQDVIHACIFAHLSYWLFYLFIYY